MPSWVTFKEPVEINGRAHTGCCVESLGEGVDWTNEHVQAFVEKTVPAAAGKVAAVDYLPYPAWPVVGSRSGTPLFCSTPHVCKGRGSCPKDYACTE